MSTPDDFAGGVAKLIEAIGEPWTGGSHQPQALRKRISRGHLLDLDVMVSSRVHFVRTDSLCRLLGVELATSTNKDGGAA